MDQEHYSEIPRMQFPCIKRIDVAKSLVSRTIKLVGKLRLPDGIIAPSDVEEVCTTNEKF